MAIRGDARSIMNKIQQFRDLSTPHQKVLLFSILTLPVVAIFLHTLGYNKTKSLLSRFLPAETSLHPPQGEELQAAHNLAGIVHTAARHNIYQANCLKQALLLWFLLGRRSIASEIKIGAQKDANSQFHAHAWVECNGEPLLDDKDTIARFSVFQESAK